MLGQEERGGLCGQFWVSVAPEASSEWLHPVNVISWGEDTGCEPDSQGQTPVPPLPVPLGPFFSLCVSASPSVTRG